MDTITMTCMDRPEYTLRVLESLKNQNKSLRKYKLYINIDTGDCEEVVNICNDIDFIETDVKVFKFEEDEVNRRISINTHNVVRRAFDEGAKFNLYLEDDIVLSPDVLNLIDWYKKQDLKKIAALCLCNIIDNSYDENLIKKIRYSCFWGFAINKLQFEKYFEPAWQKGNIWDTSIARYIRTFEGVHNFNPKLSRSTNIGEQGSNPAFRWERIMKGHFHNEDKKKFDYCIDEV